MGSIRFRCLALLAKSHLAVRLDGKVRCAWRRMGGKRVVVILCVCGCPRTRENCDSVGPIEEDKECYPKTRAAIS